MVELRLKSAFIEKSHIYRKNKKVGDMPSTLRFARLSFEAKMSTKFGLEREEIDRQKGLLLSVINQKTDINDLLEKAKKGDLSEGFDWKFGGIKSEGDCIYGRLGKIKDKTQLIFDESLKDFKLEKRQSAEVSTFLIDVKEKVIVYESKKDVGRIAPVRLLTEIFNQYHDEKETLIIKQFTDARALSKLMNELDEIISFSLKVWPTNPSSTELSKEFDKTLRNSNLEVEIRGRAKKKKDGIKIENAPWLDGGLHLAGEGYGSAHVSGKKDGKKKSIFFGRIPLTLPFEISSDDTKNIRKLLDKIKEASIILGKKH